MNRTIINIFAALLLSGLLCLTVAAQTAGMPKLRKGESYGRVRAKMLKAGWKPYHAPDADKCMAGDRRCAGRPEMESCSGTGVGACSFLWKKNGKTVAIVTAGEDDAVYQSYRIVR